MPTASASQPQHDAVEPPIVFEVNTTANGSKFSKSGMTSAAKHSSSITDVELPYVKNGCKNLLQFNLIKLVKIYFIICDAKWLPAAFPGWIKSIILLNLLTF